VEAQPTLAQGEQAYDLRIDTAVAERGNIGVMVYSYSYQVPSPETRSLQRGTANRAKAPT
jgi:hypothetical protein